MVGHVSSVKSQKGTVPLETINMQQQKGTIPLETINIQQQKQQQQTTELMTRRLASYKNQHFYFWIQPSLAMTTFLGEEDRYISN